MELLTPIVIKNVSTKLLNSKGLFLLVNQSYLCRINMIFYNKYVAQSSPLSLYLYTTGEKIRGELKNHNITSGEITVIKVTDLDIMELLSNKDE